MAPSPPKVERFDLPAGRRIAGKFEVVEKLGQGWEGEVYKIRNIRTGIEHAAKLFYPHRDKRNRSVLAYASKLNRLRHCRMVPNYHTEESIRYRNHDVLVLISEFVEGPLLSEFVRSRPGKRLPPYEALHLAHALASGLEEVHALGEYHGDLHSENIIVVRTGLKFELRMIDMYYWGRSTRNHLRSDVVDITHLLYEITGGKKHYQNHPQTIRDVCRGLKRSLILDNYTDACEMRLFLEQLEWMPDR